MKVTCLHWRPVIVQILYRIYTNGAGDAFCSRCTLIVHKKVNKIKELIGFMDDEISFHSFFISYDVQFAYVLYRYLEEFA